MNEYWGSVIAGLAESAKQPIPEKKPGMTTSEFALTASGSIALPILMSIGAINPLAGVVSGGLIAVYTLARNLFKAAHADATARVSEANSYAATNVANQVEQAVKDEAAKEEAKPEKFGRA